MTEKKEQGGKAGRGRDGICKFVERWENRGNERTGMEVREGREKEKK